MFPKMEVYDGIPKRCTAVVIAFHGKYMTAAYALSGCENDLIRQIAARNERIGKSLRQLVEHGLVVGNHEYSH